MYVHACLHMGRGTENKHTKDYLWQIEGNVGISTTSCYCKGQGLPECSFLIGFDRLLRMGSISTIAVTMFRNHSHQA